MVVPGWVSLVIQLMAIYSAIDSASGNAGRRNVQGLDITAVYQIPTQNLGTFTVSGGLNHFITFKVEASSRCGLHQLPWQL